MKKFIAVFLLSAIMIFNLSFASYAYSTVSLYYNGSPVYLVEGPYIIGGATYVPVKGLDSVLGFGYYWESASKTVVVSTPSFSAWIQANNNSIAISKNGINSTYYAGSAPCIINNRIFIPVRALADLFGLSVSWDSYSGRVSLSNAYGGSYSSSMQAGKISLSGFAAPTTIYLGKAYVLSGTVSSSALLDRVNVKVLDKATTITEINETTFNINSTLYNLSDIDNRIPFGKLSKGAKTLQITCVDKYEQRQQFSYDFTIIEPQPASSSTSSTDTMLWPVPSSGIITTIFWCDNIACHSNEGRVGGHGAIDIAANEGAPVIAVKSGIVKLSGFGTNENQKNGYGNFILLDHGNGLETQYSHLHEIYVTDGQYVNAGDTIGAVGNTGRSTGNHLDFYISKDGVRCDPLYYLNIPANATCYEPCDIKYFNAALASRGIIR